MYSTRPPELGDEDALKHFADPKAWPHLILWMALTSFVNRRFHAGQHCAAQASTMVR